MTETEQAIGGDGKIDEDDAGARTLAKLRTQRKLVAKVERERFIQ